jgi:hypothetical protein
VTPENRERLERRRAYVKAQAETANGEYYQELISELEWLNRVLPKEG